MYSQCTRNANSPKHIDGVVPETVAKEEGNLIKAAKADTADSIFFPQGERWFEFKSFLLGANKL